MKRLWRLASLFSAGLIRTHGPPSDGSIYLSFDDGPHPIETERLLELLARHDAKATFFLVGANVQAAPDTVARILAAGHAIGNHSMSHPRMPRLGLRAQLRQIDQAAAVLEGIDGHRKHPFRPPNGRVTVGILLSTLLRRRPLVLWSIDSHDYTLDAGAVIHRFRRNPPRGGDILLFHDDGDCAIRALDVLLPEWRRAGLRFLALECAR